MKNFLIVLLSAVCIWMTFTVVDTSFRSNLFQEWDYLAGIPWMSAALWDFYANILVLLLWVYYKESSIAVKVCWTILFVLLGSIAVTSYVLFQLFKLKPGEGLEKILVKNT